MTSSIGASPKSCARVRISRSRVAVLTLIVVVVTQEVYRSGYVLSTLDLLLHGPPVPALAGARPLVGSRRVATNDQHPISLARVAPAGERTGRWQVGAAYVTWPDRPGADHRARG